MASRKTPRVVAELGRPETPEETAARKARDSRNYRSRKTVNNLVYSLLVTLVVVFVVVLFVPRSDTSLVKPVDYHQIAAQTQAGLDVPLADPVLPEGWRANAATWHTGSNDRVRSWYIGLLTPSDGFIGLTQAQDANPTWLADQLQNQLASGTVVVDGVTWDVYRNARPAADRGNFDYALVTAGGSSTYLLVGTAPEDEFEVLARALSGQVQETTGG